MSLFVLDAKAINRAGDDSEVPLYVDLYFNETERAAELLTESGALSVLDMSSTSIRVATPQGLTLQGDPELRHRQPSFVIDFDQPAVGELHERLQSGDIRAGDIDAISRFVHNHISDKTYLRGFDFASTAAASAAGDCTEHAVLNAALARAESLSARVVFGIMLLDDGSAVHALSHAWTEIHDGNAWRIADATLPAQDAKLRHLRYLPLSEFSNEGPGFGYDMLGYTLLMPTRVEIVYGEP